MATREEKLEKRLEAYKATKDEPDPRLVLELADRFVTAVERIADALAYRK
jgi:hypothetical protein